MKTSRADIIRNKRQVKVLNSSLIGHSTNILRYGDHFLYKEYYQDKTFHYRLAKCHGQIKPVYNGRWLILAQSADWTMTFSYERWIEPNDVIETIPKGKVNSHIEAFFLEKETMWDK
jgi:hypothetical protein